MTFRKLTDDEHNDMRMELRDASYNSSFASALRKLMQNYQDTALELAEHDAAMEARRCPEHAARDTQPVDR